MEKKKLLGKGPFGDVYLVLNKESNKEYAMKVIDATGISIEDLNKEGLLLKNFTTIQHTNIVVCESVSSKNNQYTLLLEYCLCNNILI